MDAIAGVLAASRNARGNLSPKLKDKHVQRLRALRQRLQALKQLRTWPAPERPRENNGKTRRDNSGGKHMGGISNGEQQLDNSREDTSIEDNESVSIEDIAGAAEYRHAVRVPSLEESVMRDSAAMNAENPDEASRAVSTSQSDPSAGNEGCGDGRGGESGYGGFAADGGVAQRGGREQAERPRNSRHSQEDRSENVFENTIDENDNGDNDDTNVMKDDHRGGGDHHPRDNRRLLPSTHHHGKTMGTAGHGAGDINAFDAPSRVDRENGEQEYAPGPPSPSPLPSRSTEEPTEEQMADLPEAVSSSEVGGSGSRGRQVASDILQTRQEEASNDRGSVESEVDRIETAENGVGIAKDGFKGSQAKHGVANGESLGGAALAGIGGTSGAIERHGEGISGNQEGSSTALHRVNGLVDEDDSGENRGGSARSGTSGQNSAVGRSSAEGSGGAGGVGLPIDPQVYPPGEAPGGMLHKQGRPGEDGHQMPVGQSIEDRAEATEGKPNKGGDVAAGDSSGEDVFQVSQDNRPSDGEGLDTSGSGVGRDKAIVFSAQTQPGGTGSNDGATHSENKGGGLMPASNGGNSRKGNSAGVAISGQADDGTTGGVLGREARAGDRASQASQEVMRRWKPGVQGDNGALPVKPEDGSLEDDGSSTISSISEGEWRPLTGKSGRKRSAGGEAKGPREIGGAEAGVTPRGGPGRRKSTRAGTGEKVGEGGGAGSDGASSATKLSSASRRQVTFSSIDVSEAKCLFVTSLTIPLPFIL